VANHPLFDGPCSTGQKGQVWFLGGAYTPGTITRDCVVPPGTYLFFPLVNGFSENIGVVPPLSVQGLRDVIDPWFDAATELSATVDGTPINGLTADGIYRTKSPVFSYTYPTGSIFCHFSLCGPGLYSAAGGTVTPVVGDGFYLMLNPLSPGQHVLRFTGALPTVGLSLDVTYNITVLNRPGATLTKSVNPAQPQAGQEATFTVTLSLQNAVQGATLEDVLSNAGASGPSGTHYVNNSATLDDNPIANPAPTATQQDRLGLRFTLGDLAAGTHTLTYRVRFSANLGCHTQATDGASLDAKDVVGHIATAQPISFRVRGPAATCG
jgi:uncharacterized repeat protein (TIGR01451 family)